MSKIREFGDSVLRKKCEEVTVFDDNLKNVIRNLLDTVRSTPTGVGLAAPQIGVSLRLFVISLWEYDKAGKVQYDTPIVYINPKILSYSEEQVYYDEGCLSIPGVYHEVERPKEIVIEAKNEQGEVFRQDLTGYHARVFLHENDHLNGVLFIDRLPPRARKSLDRDLQRIKKK
ncbi:MAG: peptide deformylase [Chlamydiales bacterium]|nr:peptide deformylase [Chlamydiales bacterium]